jgi:hypothetical protein
LLVGLPEVTVSGIDDVGEGGLAIHVEASPPTAGAPDRKSARKLHAPPAS